MSPAPTNPPTKPLGFAARLFNALRTLDVDAIGRATFKHCMSPKALYVTLIERWWVLATCAIIGACIGVVTIKTAVKQFESHGKILVYQKLPTFMDDSTRLPDPKAYDSLFATHVALIGSPLIIQKAVEDYDLVNKCPEIQAELEENREYAYYIQQHLRISRAGSGDSKGAFVISVSFEHLSARECPIVVKAILETYRDYTNSSILDDQNRAVEVMGDIKNSLEADVKAKGLAYRELMKTASGVWDRSTENNTHQRRIEALQDELTTLELKKAATESRIRIMSRTHDLKTGKKLSDLARLALIDEAHISRLEMLLSVKGEAITELYQNAYPELQEYANARFRQLSELLLEREELVKNISPKHPKVQDLDSKIQMLESLLDSSQKKLAAPAEPKGLQPADIVSAYVRMLDEELNDANDRLAVLNTSIQSEITAAKSLTDFTIHATQLKDDYERSKDLYAALIDKAQKQQVLSQFGSYVAEIIAYPHFKGELTWPKKPVILALCTILGIFAGSFLALALDLIALTPLKQAFWFVPQWLVWSERSPAGSV